MGTGSDISIDDYNKLHLINCADARLAQQLETANITQEKLFSQLLPLFMSDGVSRGPYAICLIHRHHKLRSGERMVSFGKSIRPTDNDSANIIPERWLSTGTAMEYMFSDDPTSMPPPPSPQLLSKFNNIVQGYNIDVLGISYAPPVDKEQPDHIFMEKGGSRDREQVISVVPRKDSNGIHASWIPSERGDVMVLCGNCSLELGPSKNHTGFCCEADDIFPGGIN